MKAFRQKETAKSHAHAAGGGVLGRLLAVMLCIAVFWPVAVPAKTLSLDQAVAEALKNSPRISEAAARQATAAYDTDTTRADYFPKAAAAYSYMGLADAPFVRLGGQQAQINSTQQYHWEVSLIQPLFTGFALSARHRLAQLGLEIRALEADETALAVARDAKLAYYNLLMAMKARDVARAAQTNLTGHADDAERFFNQGLMPRNDLLKSQVALAEAVQDQVRADAAVRSAVSALNIVIGRGYAADTEVIDIETVAPTDGDMDVDELITEALSNRPDVAALERAVAARGEAIRLANSDYYPRVELTGKYQQDGDDLLATNNDYTNQYNASIGIQAKWVFFEAGKTRATAAKARSQRRELEQSLRRLKDNVRLKVQQAWLDLGVAEKNVATMRAALDQAREHWRITNSSYRQQLTTSTEVLDARTYLTRAETGYYQALYGCGIAAADLDLAVGRK